MRPTRLLGALALVLAAAAAPAQAKPTCVHHTSCYEVGVASRSINPGPDGKFGGQPVFLGGYGFGGPPVQSGRAATGILGDGIHVRAFAVSDGRHPFAIADIETQGQFVAEKDGPYGLLDIRKAVQTATGGKLP